MYYVDSSGSIDIGFVKIGMLNSENHSTSIPDEFPKLENEYFSLGQGKEYYKKLNKLVPEIRINILKSMNDIAYDLELFDKVIDLEVTRTSLLRDYTGVFQQVQLKSENLLLKQLYVKSGKK